jgi:flagellar hook assembly protein FlgD
VELAREVNGSTKVTWDGVDEAGRRVSAGIYLLRFETAGSHASRRMVRLK